MRFREIPRYTQDGYYRVDVSLDYLLWTLEDYEERYGLELIPDFQRGHIWTREQQVTYVEHVLRGGIGSSEFRFNHPGWMRSFDGHMVLVDGLQRITALRLFLVDAIKVFGLLRSEFEDEIPLDLSVGFRVNNLPTRADVLRWYLEINAGGTPHTDNELKRVEGLLEAEKVSR